MGQRQYDVNKLINLICDCMQNCRTRSYFRRRKCNTRTPVQPSQTRSYTIGLKECNFLLKNKTQKASVTIMADFCPEFNPPFC